MKQISEHIEGMSSVKMSLIHTYFFVKMPLFRLGVSLTKYIYDTEYSATDMIETFFHCTNFYWVKCTQKINTNAIGETKVVYGVEKQKRPKS